MASGGIFFGLGFYTYSSFRLAVLLLFGVLLYFWFIYRKQNQKKFTSCLLQFAIPAFIVALPIGIYFLLNPANFVGRLGPISIFSQSSPIKAFFVSLLRHLAMFNFSGDFNWRHNISGSPQLFWPVGILFLIGVIGAVKGLFSALKRKNFSTFFVFGFLFLWFFVLLLGGILTYEGIPHALRTIGVIPPVYIFSAFGAFLIIEIGKKILPKNKYLKPTFLFLSFLIVILLIVGQYNRYFIVWAKNENVKGAFTQPFVEMGEYLNSLPENIEKYVIVNEPGVSVPYPDGIPVPAQTLMFQERIRSGAPRAVYLKPEEIDKIKIEDKAVILLMKDDEEILNKLKEKFPQGIINKNYPIITFEVLKEK
jgi:hypothetical protein